MYANKEEINLRRRHIKKKSFIGNLVCVCVGFVGLGHAIVFLQNILLKFMFHLRPPKCSKLAHIKMYNSYLLCAHSSVGGVLPPPYVLR